MLLESQFQDKLVKKIKKRFPGCVVMKTDPTYLIGIPDLVILYRNCWAMLETKRSKTARHGNNQDYWVDRLNNASYASFVYPENEEEVMRELQQTFTSHR